MPIECMKQENGFYVLFFFCSQNLFILSYDSRSTDKFKIWNKRRRRYIFFLTKCFTLGPSPFILRKHNVPFLIRLFQTHTLIEEDTNLVERVSDIQCLLHHTGLW